MIRGPPRSTLDRSSAASDVYKRQVLSKEEGGRHTPFFNNYRPQFYFRTTDVTGAVVLLSLIHISEPTRPY